MIHCTSTYSRVYSRAAPTRTYSGILVHCNSTREHYCINTILYHNSMKIENMCVHRYVRACGVSSAGRLRRRRQSYRPTADTALGASAVDTHAVLIDISHMCLCGQIVRRHRQTASERRTVRWAPGPTPRSIGAPPRAPYLCTYANVPTVRRHRSVRGSGIWKPRKHMKAAARARA